jgi:hypothetical protein
MTRAQVAAALIMLSAALTTYLPAPTPALGVDPCVLDVECNPWLDTVSTPTTTT